MKACIWFSKLVKRAADGTLPSDGRDRAGELAAFPAKLARWYDLKDRVYRTKAAASKFLNLSDDRQRNDNFHKMGELRTELTDVILRTARELIGSTSVSYELCLYYCEDKMKPCLKHHKH